ncbi:hypothetical protein Q3G72_025500 [Acer saccharum]|nr:hypothetical protein Q3G72_019148 [Acer saccharum]KAK1583609.1 hypothetical protein Q3G72_025500 [Acer saccharum]
MAFSKNTFLLLGFAFVVVLLISSHEVSADQESANLGDGHHGHHGHHGGHPGHGDGHHGHHGHGGHGHHGGHPGHGGATGEN